MLAAAPPPPPPVVVGRSVEGRPIVARRIGDPESAGTVLVVGAIHGDEGAGRAIVGALAGSATLAGADVWLVSTVNPDGTARRTRTNARGVDLNRNFPRAWRPSAPGRGDYGGPRPLSEPETRAVRALVLRIRPRVTIWFHQPWGQVLAPCRGPARLQRRYAAIARLPLKRCRGSDLPGTATRWQARALPGTTAFVVELRAGALRASAVARHVRAVRAVVAATAPGALSRLAPMHQRHDDDRRSPVERLVGQDLDEQAGKGRPLSSRARQTQRSIEAYLQAGLRPRWMERVGDIDAGIARERRRLARAYRALRGECAGDPELFARRWTACARSWPFEEELNELIEQHNAWYPIERDLPLNPRTGDYVRVAGRSYRRPQLGPEWVLEQFPPWPATAEDAG